MAYTYDVTTDRGKVRLRLGDASAVTAATSGYTFEDDEISKDNAWTIPLIREKLISVQKLPNKEHPRQECRMRLQPLKWRQHPSQQRNNARG